MGVSLLEKQNWYYGNHQKKIDRDGEQGETLKS